MANIQYTLSSGRKLGITAMGEPLSPRIVVFCHPAPGSSLFDPDPLATAKRTIHIIAADRPGYGSSDPLPAGEWPSVARAADDLSEYLLSSEGAAHALGKHELDRVGVVGWSAGGRVALALAAKHPDLVDRVAIFGTPAPNEEVPWVDPRQTEMIERLAQLSPDEALQQLVDKFYSQMRDLLPSQNQDEPVPLDLLGASDADKKALEYPGVRSRLDSMLRDAFRQGPVGAASDILAYSARPWGFDLSDIKANVLLMYGENDPIAGPEHATWYRNHLSDTRVEVIPDAGHMLVVPTWDRALAHLEQGRPED